MKIRLGAVSLLVMLLSVMAVAEVGDADELGDSESVLYDDGFSSVIEEDIYQDVDDVALEGDAGLTPDSSFYFLESLIESVLVGDDPVKALEYKEEKILELQEMVEQGNEKAAGKVLERVEKYNEILRREVSPEIEQRVRESSKAVKGVLEGLDLEGEKWGEIQEKVDNNVKIEDKIALAAKVSRKISELCEALSTLDPLEYSKVCKSGDEAPRWKKDLDRKLTAEQEKEAKKFFEVMSDCFQNPAECRCEEISIKPFAKQCSVMAPLAAKCESGNEEACQQMDKMEDPIDILPDYLQEVMMEVEDRYGDAKHDLFMPPECVAEGALSREACFKVMFRLNAPPECQEALEAGKIDPKNEREARAACEEIMFTANAPEECIEAGLKDHRECEKFMFKLDAPEECIEAGLKDHRVCERFMFKLDAPQECSDAGLTGSGRDDWKKCEAIRFKIDAPKECVDAGLTGSGRDDWKKCDAIRFKLDAPKECFDAGIDGTGRDDWKKCDLIKFKLEVPQECLDAGLDGSGRDDWKKCNKIRFLLEAPEECHKFANERDPWKACQPIQFKRDASQVCLDAGLDGTGRDDWKKCEKLRFLDEAPEECHKFANERDPWRACQPIQFKRDAPQECIDAGLDGSGRDDWKKCDKIRREMEQQQPPQEGDPREGNFNPDDRGGEFPQENRRDGQQQDQCRDCAQRCGDRRWDCNEGRCECFDEGNDRNDGSSGDDQPSDSGTGGGAGDSGSSDFGDGSSDRDDSGSGDHPDSDSGSSGGSSDSGSSGSGDSGSSGSDSGSGSDDRGSETPSEGSGDSTTGSAVNIFNPTGSAVRIFDPVPEKRFRELGRLR